MIDEYRQYVKSNRYIVAHSEAHECMHFAATEARRITCLINGGFHTAEELRTFARVTGHSDIHDLSKADLFTTSREVAEYTDIRHC